MYASNIIIHQLFNSVSKANDIALIKLKKDLKSSQLKHLSFACILSDIDESFKVKFY